MRAMSRSDTAASVLVITLAGVLAVVWLLGRLIVVGIGRVFRLGTRQRG